MKTFADLTEREVLAVAISSEEEDSRIYMTFAEDLRERYPDSAKIFEQMAEEERGHRHMLLETYEQRFGPHLPPIRREDVKGFLRRRPVWLTKNLSLDTIRREVETMAETVAKEMPSPAAIAANQWLPDNELAYYSAEYGRTGFQGGLQWYRCGTSAAFNNELQLFSGRSIDVPSCFISGKQDWGTYQRPGVFEAMQKSACTRMLGCHLVDGAGHWVQQEQPAEVSRLLLEFLRQARASG